MLMRVPMLVRAMRMARAVSVRVRVGRAGRAREVVYELHRVGHCGKRRRVDQGTFGKLGRPVRGLWDGGGRERDNSCRPTMARDKPRRRATPAIEPKDKSSPRAAAKMAPEALKPYRIRMRQLSKFSNFEAERTLVLGVYVLTQTHKKAFLHTNFEYRPLQVVRGCRQVRESLREAKDKRAAVPRYT